jgi:hypothetical protein
MAGSLGTLARTGRGSLTDLIARPWAQTTEGPRFARTICCGDCSLTPDVTIKPAPNDESHLR